MKLLKVKTKMKKTILELFEKIKANKLNFPCRWSDTRILNGIEFKTYFNDDRDYFVVDIVYPNNSKLSFTIENENSILINGTLNKIHTLKEVVSALQFIINFAYNSKENIDKVKRQIKEKRQEKKNIDLEIKNLKNLIVKK